jgi:hypothetical protein
MRRRTIISGAWVLGWAIAHLPVCGIAGSGALAPPDSATLALQTEYGITLALVGNPAKAESVFVSLLSQSPSDPRALTNLGNLNLLRGDLRIAAAFYEMALRQEPSDHGIRLNHAIALMLQGKTTEATREAASAMSGAGGEAQALDLLGVRPSDPSGPVPKAGAVSFLSEDEVRTMLAAAARAIPADSGLGLAGSTADDSIIISRTSGPDSGRGGNGAPPDSVASRGRTVPAQPVAPRKVVDRRPAGSRASGEAETWRLLYWKH